MSRHFEFDANSWLSPDSRAFANELSCASAESRDRVCREFGLSLTFDKKGLRLDYDGKKIGFGTFDSPGGKITFLIKPKVDDIDVRSLFDVIEKLNLTNKIVDIRRSQEASVREEEAAFSWVFLLGLLNEIDAFGVHHFSIFNSKKVLRNRSSVTGRPIAKSLAINLGLGRFGIDCEVLDNYRQRQYASLFMATAKSVFQDLIGWQNTLGRGNVNIQGIYVSIVSKLKQFSDIPFSTRLITELARPPFSFGVKSLVLQCIQYWRWKGIFASDGGAATSPFWSISISLEKAFELYAGHVFHKLLENFKKIPKNLYSYAFEFTDSRIKNNWLDRSIEPDHIYESADRDVTVISEIKYSNNMAVREHVSQLIAYLAYNKYPFKTNKKVGLLVYPGGVFNIEKIPNFNFDIFILTLPVKEQITEVDPGVSDFFRLLDLR